MSTHGTIKLHGCVPGLADPDIVEGQGICIEVNVPEFLWADDIEEAIAFFDAVIENAKAGKRKLRKKELKK